MPLAPEVLDHPADAGALRMPEDQAAAGVLLDAEQVQVGADAPVVALCRFLQAPEVGLERLRIGPGGAVDAPQLLVGRIAAPVGAGGAGQLEGLEVSGGGHVRTAAEVLPFALAVQRDGLVRGNPGDDLGLVVLADGSEILHRVVAGHGLAGHGQVGLRQFLHALLDALEVLGSEPALVGKIVVEAVLDHRTDRDLGAGEKLLDGLRQQVRGGVTQHFQPVRVPGGHDRDIGVVFDTEIGVDELPAHPSGQRRARQAGADIGGHVGHAGRLVVGAAAAVGKRYFRHPAIVREMRRRSSFLWLRRRSLGPLRHGAPGSPAASGGRRGLSIRRRRGFRIVPACNVYASCAGPCPFCAPCRVHGPCRVAGRRAA